ncbi:MAG: aminotransferase [Granulosicoccaceae bacterium]
MSQTEELHSTFENYKSMSLDLNMERGQPSDANFDLSLKLLSVIDESNYITDSGVDIRNYPGGTTGLVEAREMFSELLRVQASEVMVGNNSSLELMGHFLSWALLRGVKDSTSSWIGQKPKLIVTVPGYDRHYGLASQLGYELLTVPMTAEGPDIEAVEALARQDASVKGIYFVPTYSNPTGDTVSEEVATRLVSMQTAAADFCIFADDAYAVHHLVDQPVEAPNLLSLAKAHGNADRVILFGSTSKVTFASAGISLAGMSEANIQYWSKLFSAHSIGPNKAEQWRHVCFLRQYPDGLKGLMKQHAKLLKPKFEVVEEVLNDQLGNKNLARWSSPEGGYFVSVDTQRPIADQVVALAAELGVSLTPAGATFPGGIDPNNTNIRLSPTRPSTEQVRRAMEVFCCCVELASHEYDQAQ